MMFARWHAAAFISRRLFVMMLVTASVVTLYSAVAANVDGSSGAARYTVGTGTPNKTLTQTKPAGSIQSNDTPETESAASPTDPSTGSSPREYVRPDDGPSVASTRPESASQPTSSPNPPDSSAGRGPSGSNGNNGSSSDSAVGATEPSDASVHPAFSISAKSPAVTGNRDNVVRVVNQDQLAFDFGNLQPGSRYIWLDAFSVQNLTAVPVNFTVSSSGNASLWFSTDGGSRWSLRSTSPTTTVAMGQLRVSVQVEVPGNATGGESKADVTVSATQKGVNQ